MYRCVCDWLGLPYKEEVQWVGVIFDTIYFLYSAVVNVVLLLNNK